LEARLVDAEEALPAADVVVANISLDSVQRLTGRLACRTLVTSGYLASDEPLLPGYQHVERRTLDGWACDVFRAG
jgi:hypothetical protein